MLSTSSTSSLVVFKSLTEEPKRVAPNLLNEAASPEAKLLDVSLRLEVYENDDFRSLTDEEWARVVIRAPGLRMRSSEAAKVIVEIEAPNRESFTVKDLAAAIVETERKGRGESQWLGGIDVHHIYSRASSSKRTASGSSAGAPDSGSPRTRPMSATSA